MSITNFRNHIRLLSGAMLICVIWLGVLPAVSQHWQIAENQQRLSERGIDSSAMFYSELECIPQLTNRLQKMHQANPDALWIPQQVHQQR